MQTPYLAVLAERPSNLGAFFAAMVAYLAILGVAYSLGIARGGGALLSSFSAVVGVCVAAAVTIATRPIDPRPARVVRAAARVSPSAALPALGKIARTRRERATLRVGLREWKTRRHATKAGRLRRAAACAQRAGRRQAARAFVAWRLLSQRRGEGGGDAAGGEEEAMRARERDAARGELIAARAALSNRDATIEVLEQLAAGASRAADTELADARARASAALCAASQVAVESLRVALENQSELFRDALRHAEEERDLAQAKLPATAQAQRAEHCRAQDDLRAAHAAALDEQRRLHSERSVEWAAERAAQQARHREELSASQICSVEELRLAEAEAGAAQAKLESTSADILLRKLQFVAIRRWIVAAQADKFGSQRTAFTRWFNASHLIGAARVLAETTTRHEFAVDTQAKLQGTLQQERAAHEQLVSEARSSYEQQIASLTEHHDADLADALEEAEHVTSELIKHKKEQAQHFARYHEITLHATALTLHRVAKEASSAAVAAAAAARSNFETATNATTSAESCASLATAMSAAAISKASVTQLRSSLKHHQREIRRLKLGSSVRLARHALKRDAFRALHAFTTLRNRLERGNQLVAHYKKYHADRSLSNALTAWDEAVRKRVSERAVLRRFETKYKGAIKERAFDVWSHYTAWRGNDRYENGWSGEMLADALSLGVLKMKEGHEGAHCEFSSACKFVRKAKDDVPSKEQRFRGVIHHAAMYSKIRELCKITESFTDAFSSGAFGERSRLHSFDRRFVASSIDATALETLRNISAGFLEHLTGNPESLLVKLLALVSVTSLEQGVQKKSRRARATTSAAVETFTEVETFHFVITSSTSTFALPPTIDAGDYGMFRSKPIATFEISGSTKDRLVSLLRLEAEGYRQHKRSGAQKPEASVAIAAGQATILLQDVNLSSQECSQSIRDLLPLAVLHQRNLHPCIANDVHFLSSHGIAGYRLVLGLHRAGMPLDFDGGDQAGAKRVAIASLSESYAFLHISGPFTKKEWHSAAYISGLKLRRRHGDRKGVTLLDVPPEEYAARFSTSVKGAMTSV